MSNLMMCTLPCGVLKGEYPDHCVFSKGNEEHIVLVRNDDCVESERDIVESLIETEFKDIIDLLRCTEV